MNNISRKSVLLKEKRENSYSTGKVIPIEISITKKMFRWDMSDINKIRERLV